MGRDPCRGARKRTPSSNYVREREGGLTLFIDTLHWELTTLHMLIIQVYLLCSNFANKNKRVLTV